MKIFIDINHPAHVHYFRNFMRIMEQKGHTFLVTNRDYPIINQLLDAYGIEHTIRQKRTSQKGTISSMIYLIRTTFFCIRQSLSFHPDLYLGFASSPCAITAFFFRKPSILLDDTEFNTTNHTIYKNICSAVLTPFYFNTNLGQKQLRFNAYIEQLYLHDYYFSPSMDVLNEFGLQKGKYVIVRYSSFDAHHDLGVAHLSEDAKKRIVQKVSQHYQVLISFETIPDDDYLRQFAFTVAPEKMHHLMAGARFIITEGITMASESYILGVPFIDLNPLHVGYVDLQVKMHPEFAMQSTSENEVMQRLDYLLANDLNGSSVVEETRRMTINPTSFLVWFVENYPESFDLIKNNSNTEFNFE